MWVTPMRDARGADCSSFFSRITLKLILYGFGARKLMVPSTDNIKHRITALADPLREAAREAGLIAQGYFRPGEKTSARIWSKDGGSPVTEADVSVDAFLKIRLSQLLPEAAWLSEETADNDQRLGARLVWIVDPIDGTRAFLSGHRDWSVAIALLLDDAPVLGVVHAPALDTLYEAQAGAGALANGAAITVSPASDLRRAGISGPQPMIDAMMRRVGGMTPLAKVPSLALRLARVAAGDIDVALVSRNARDWDLAAADLILREAGGAVTDMTGRDPRYNAPHPVHGELVATSSILHPRLIEAMTGAAEQSRAV
jgi:myo-inositol-1(or 4)-monophosphatase